LLKQKDDLILKEELNSKEEKFLENIYEKIDKSLKTKEKNYKEFEIIISNCFKSPKPIYRELLLAPEYLIFIDSFKFEEKIISYLKNHNSVFYLYMGNSEFAANYEYYDCVCERKNVNELNSITGNTENILFEVGKKYTNLYMATKTVNNRQYMDYKNIVICNKPIKLKNTISAYSVLIEDKIYNCEFV